MEQSKKSSSRIFSATVLDPKDDLDEVNGHRLCTFLSVRGLSERALVDLVPVPLRIYIVIQGLSRALDSLQTDRLLCVLFVTVLVNVI